MAAVVVACVIVAGVMAITFLPFATGGYDMMASPLAMMAWVLGVSECCSSRSGCSGSGRSRETGPRGRAG